MPVTWCPDKLWIAWVNEFVKHSPSVVLKMRESDWLGFNSSFVLMMDWSLASLGLASLRCDRNVICCLFVFLPPMDGAGILVWLWWLGLISLVGSDAMIKKIKPSFYRRCLIANPRWEPMLDNKGDKARQFGTGFNQCHGHSKYWSYNSMKL